MFRDLAIAHLVGVAFLLTVRCFPLQVITGSNANHLLEGCYQFFVRDLSRLQRAESRLRDTQMRLQQILDNSTNALVYAKDLAGR